MKIFGLWLVRLWLVLFAGVFQSSRAAVAGELPTIGYIDFYGLNGLPEEQLLRVMALRQGDPIPIDFPASMTPEQLRKGLELPDGAPLPATKLALPERLQRST